MSFITKDFEFYDIKDKININMMDNIESEMQEIFDKSLMATFEKIEQDCYYLLDNFNQCIISIGFESTYNSYIKQYNIHAIKPFVKSYDYKNEENSKKNSSEYSLLLLSSTINSMMEPLKEIYSILSIFKEPDKKIEYSFDACDYENLYDQMDEQYKNKINYLPDNLSAQEYLDLAKEQLEKIKIALFMSLSAKYGQDFSIQLKRDINNKLIKELIFPLEKREYIKKEFEYHKIIELNEKLAINQETINYSFFNSIKSPSIREYYEKQSTESYMKYENKFMREFLKVDSVTNNKVKKRI